jgi:hypothetical protein
MITQYLKLYFPHFSLMDGTLVNRKPNRALAAERFYEIDREISDHMIAHISRTQAK